MSTALSLSLSLSLSLQLCSIFSVLVFSVQNAQCSGLDMCSGLGLSPPPKFKIGGAQLPSNLNDAVLLLIYARVIFYGV